MPTYRALRGTLAALLIAIITLILLVRPAYGDGLSNRSVRIGTPNPGAVTSHLFTFTTVTSATVGSIELLYCSNSPLIVDPCTAPTGLSLSSATISSQTGMTGFTKHASSTANKFILTRGPAAETPLTATYNLATVTNPTNPAETTFVRVSIYPTDDATGTRGEFGGLAFSTSGALATIVYVPPHLTTCVGISVSSDCSSAVGSLIDLGDLSTTSAKTATSQFAASTNDPAGYTTSIAGNTMTSGNNTIAAINSSQASSPGTNQFGINLRANTTPSVGSNPTGGGSGLPAANYNSPNAFKFTSGDAIASSPISTDFNTYTISYIVNISSSQPIGIYSTTMTFISVAAF